MYYDGLMLYVSFLQYSVNKKEQITNKCNKFGEMTLAQTVTYPKFFGKVTPAYFGELQELK